MNKVVLVGRITKDPELKYTASNLPVVQFTIAVNRVYQSKSGEKQADFISCVVWRQQAENFAKYMRKGSLIGIDGQIQTRNYDDPNGVKRYVTEVLCESIHYLSKVEQGEGQAQQPAQENHWQKGNSYQAKSPHDFVEKKQEAVKNPFEENTTEFEISSSDLPF